MSVHLVRVRFTFIAVLFSGVFSNALCVGQTVSAKNPGDTVNPFTDAENKWRLHAVDLETQVDAVRPRVRAERNRYWKADLQTPKDMERKGLRMLEGIGLSGGPEVPEVPIDPTASWVIAAFDNYAVFPIAPDGQTSREDLILYTELNFSIKYLIASPKSSPMTVGSAFQVDLPGGCLKLRNGAVVSWRVFPARHSVQPNHTYLMELLPLDGGLFHIAQRWDVTSGTAQPDTPGEIERARTGAAQVSGMTIQELLSYVPTVLSVSTK